MSKISAYPEAVDVSVAAYVDVAYGNMNYRMQLKNLLASIVLNPRLGGSYRDDMLNVDATHYPLGWILAGTGGGTSGVVTEANHPGIRGLRAGGGLTASLKYGTSSVEFMLVGSEETDAIFRLATVSDLLVIFGFHDSPNSGTPSLGAYINITNATLSGITKAAGTSSTPVTYTVSTGVWYRARIVVNEDASQVDFYLFDSAGLELWHQALTSNIPTTAAQLVTHALVAMKSSAGTIVVIDVDLLTLRLPKELMR